MDKRSPSQAYSHYYRACPFSGIDVYRILLLFGVTDPCLQAAVKKILIAGGRGGGKDIRQDVQEAIASLQRWQEMRAEEVNKSDTETEL